MASGSFQGKHSQITGQILDAFYRVHTKLGYGFTEKVYENSMAIELQKTGLQTEQQKAIDVYYDRESVGTYYADIVVNSVVIVELKAVKQIAVEHEAQTLNYLKASQIEVGLLLNFGPSPSFKRFVLDNQRKGDLSWVQPMIDDQSSKPLTDTLE